MYSNLAYQIKPMTPSSHWTNRTRPVDAVVIHYTACTVREAEDLVTSWEASNPYTSSNYIIDVYGRITAVVPEEYRPYTTGSWGLGARDIDDHAITIECSCDEGDITRINDITLLSVCQLLADIGKRYGIRWDFTGGETGNIHAHRWYQSTPCPGDNLFFKFTIIEQMSNLMMDAQRTLPKYDSIQDLPEWAVPEIAWLIDEGYLKGTEEGLRLNDDLLRALVILVRVLKGELHDGQ